MAQSFALPRKAFSHALKRFYDYIADVDGVGAQPAVTGLSASEQGAGPIHKTVFTFEDVDFALVDEAGVVAYAGKKLYDFPAGHIKVLGAVADLDVVKDAAGVNDAFDGDFGLGTATASNNGTLAATEQDIIPTTATPQAVAGATTAQGKNAADIAPLDGTGTPVDLFLNFLVDDADHDVTTTPTNLTVSGTVTVTWVNLGDFA